MRPDAADGLPVMSDEEIEATGPVTHIGAYRPAYRQRCENCEQSPVVKGVLNGVIVYDGSMCGPCTWGEARTIDPSTWNE